MRSRSTSSRRGRRSTAAFSSAGALAARHPTTFLTASNSGSSARETLRALGTATAGGEGAARAVRRPESAELSAYVNEHKTAVAVSSVAVTADEFATHALAAVRGPRLVDAAADA